MAKKKNEVVGLTCSVCKSRNYSTTRNKVNIEGKLKLKKYCKQCGKMQMHKEASRLK